jgi:hypothetical protein
MTDRLRLILIGAFAAMFILGLAYVGRAEQPECTGDRHYDGVACCPTADPNSTVCPTVTCKDGDDVTVQQRVFNITVNRCPSVPPAPMYTRCTQRRDGAKPHKHDVVFNGHRYHCSAPTTPKRFYLPVN